MSGLDEAFIILIFPFAGLVQNSATSCEPFSPIYAQPPQSYFPLFALRYSSPFAYAAFWMSKGTSSPDNLTSAYPHPLDVLSLFHTAACFIRYF